MPRKRRILMAVAGLASAAFAIATSPGLAQAAVQQPSTACTNAEAIYSVYIYPNGASSGTIIGKLQLWYSPTCRETWAYVISKYSPGDVYAYIASTGNAGVQECPPNGIGGYMSCTTPKINDAGLTSYAYGQVWDGSTPGWAYTPTF